MSGKLVGQVYSLQLSRTEREVLIALCQRADDDGTRVYPSAGLLAWELDFSERHIRRVLEALEQKQLIRIVAYPSGGRGKATRYEIHLENGTLKAARGKDENPDILEQNPDISEINPDTQMSAFNKEADAKPGHFGTINPDILEQNPDIWMSYESSIEPPEESSVKSAIAGARAGATLPRKKCTFPPGFLVTAEMHSWAIAKFPELDVGDATESWRDDMIAKGFEYVDWQAAWRKGMRNAVKWAAERVARNGNGGGSVKGAQGDEQTKFGRAVIRAGREIAELFVDQPHAGTNGRAAAHHQGADILRLPDPKTTTGRR